MKRGQHTTLCAILCVPMGVPAQLEPVCPEPPPCAQYPASHLGPPQNVIALLGAPLSFELLPQCYRVQQSFPDNSHPQQKQWPQTHPHLSCPCSFTALSPRRPHHLLIYLFFIRSFEKAGTWAVFWLLDSSTYDAAWHEEGDGQGLMNSQHLAP